MARSHRIYVVMSGPFAIKAFTVKHELLTYLERRARDPLMKWGDGFQVHVLPDGREGTPGLWGAAEYLRKRGKE